MTSKLRIEQKIEKEKNNLFLIGNMLDDADTELRRAEKRKKTVLSAWYEQVNKIRLLQEKLGKGAKS